MGVFPRSTRSLFHSQRDARDLKTVEVNYLNKDKGIQKCPGCLTWCFRAPETGVCVRCQMCTNKRGQHFDFCWVCLKTWRGAGAGGTCGNPGCDGRGHRLRILATCEMKEINGCQACPSVRGCPRFGLLITLKDRCAHVNCTNCRGYGYCFICLKEQQNGK